MIQRTVELVDYDTYLADPHAGGADIQSDQEIERKEREARLATFPHAIMLRLSYPELDFTNRWCWQQFGPTNGECQQHHSEYPACSVQGAHAHEGVWLSHWLAKIDYDFGYNEWYFATHLVAERFLAFVRQLSCTVPDP
jgi:hypothetical protein